MQTTPLDGAPVVNSYHPRQRMMNVYSTPRNQHSIIERPLTPVGKHHNAFVDLSEVPTFFPAENSLLSSNTQTNDCSNDDPRGNALELINSRPALSFALRQCNAMIQKHRSGRRLIATDVLSKIPTLPFQLASATQTKHRVPSSKATADPIMLDEPRKSSVPQAHPRRRLTYSARTTSDPLAMKLPNSRRVSISHLINRNQSYNARCA
jgi:hypothetical protein